MHRGCLCISVGTLPIHFVLHRYFNCLKYKHFMGLLVHILRGRLLNALRGFGSLGITIPSEIVSLGFQDAFRVVQPSASLVESVAREIKAWAAVELEGAADFLTSLLGATHLLRPQVTVRRVLSSLFINSVCSLI